MASMSSIDVSATGSRIPLETDPKSLPSPCSCPAPAPDLDNLGSDFSVERRKERLVRLPNHLKPSEGKREELKGIIGV